MEITQIEELSMLEEAEIGQEIDEAVPGLTLEDIEAIVSGCDEVILDAIIARQAAMREANVMAIAMGLPVSNISRENTTIRALQERARQKGVDTAVVHRLWGDVLFQSDRLGQRSCRKIGKSALGNTEDAE